MEENDKRTAARACVLAQDGLISSEQARAAGFSASAVGRRLSRGDWVPAAPRVYRDAGVPGTTRSRVRAAAMSVRGATLAGRTAAWWWRLSEDEPAVVDLVVEPGRRPRPRSGVRIVERSLADDDVMVVDGLWVTKRAPTLLTAVADLEHLAGARLLDRALLSGRVGLDELREAHVRTCARRGSPRARALLALAGGGARSQAERTAIRTIRAEKITGWVANLELRLPHYGPAVLDLAFPALRVVVEIDGWAYHRDLRAFLRDARRQNALAAAGWTVIRTNWYELHEAPAAFVGVLLATLGRRSPRPERVAR